MTNERAIKLLHRISDSQFDGEYGDERREALEMAVRALEGDGDLISRKQVLNASHFVACWDGVEHFSLEVVDADFIQKLPSVQPTQSNAQSTQINTLDCVSRQAAIDALGEEPEVWEYDDEYGMGQRSEWCYIKKIIEKLPSAQPHWIPCSERLPEEDVYVLICYKYKEGEGDSSHVYIDMTSYGQAYFGGRKCSFKEWRSPFEYFHANYEVVAWMPLPKPYGGESDV